jgi:hypothetical protein
MRKCIVMAAGTALALSACGYSEPYGAYSEEAEAVAFDMELSEEGAEEAMPADEQTGEIPTSEPQIAYTYQLGFDVPMAEIKAIQQKHAQMCEDLGARQCRIITMRQAKASSEYASGNLRIAVAASKARDFAKALEASTSEADGELTSSTLSGEDLSKNIVDTEARLKSRELLRDRLTDILASRRGTVGELVEAERAVAQVNQEIDQARSWLETMKSRVAFSDMTITYEAGERSAVSGGFFEPIESAWNSLGSILGGTIAAIMMALTALLPITAVILALRWVLHRFGYRLRFWQTDLREAKLASEAASEV